MTNPLTDSLKKIIEHSLQSFENVLFRFPMHGEANILGNHYEICIDAGEYETPNGSRVIDIRISRPSWYIKFKMNANISQKYGEMNLVFDGTATSIWDIRKYGYIDDMQKDMALVRLT